MIEFDKTVLDNGLTLLVHRDTETPMVAVNTLFDVGARDEDESRTGFAHLFEHLMFGGSVNVPEFDKPLQLAGGQNNAFTSNDITNYYDTLPANNLETALWLESDRMLSLAFTDKSLEVQKSVVIEEFKQRYLNQPYGDVWHLIREKAYLVHPYKWPTIGKDISHVEDAVMEDVKAFFKKHYSPQNAILCVSGNVNKSMAVDLVNKWYGDIPAGDRYVRNIEQEPEQNEYRRIDHVGKVPANALYMAFKMCSRQDKDYPATDLISDILGRGKSSRLYDLISGKKFFSDISAYVMGSFDNGMLVISGHLNEGVSFDDAENGVWDVVGVLGSESFNARELDKVKNKYESAKLFSDTNVLNRAMNLCYFELLGDAQDANHELSAYRAVTPEDIQRIAHSVLKRNNCTVLRYAKES